MATRVTEVAVDTRRRDEIYSEGNSQRGRPETESRGLVHEGHSTTLLTAGTDDMFVKVTIMNDSICPIGFS